MAVIEIAKFVSCTCFPEELTEALALGYSEVYIRMPDNSFLKHSTLSYNRHIRMKVDTIPKAVSDLYPVPVLEVKEEINFLPAGKIPYLLLRQIVAFFKEVMTVKKSDFEAMAFILWTPALGYHISIPKQTVSKAAVNFAYDQDTIPAGSVLVVDIH